MTWPLPVKCGVELEVRADVVVTGPCGSRAASEHGWVRLSAWIWVFSSTHSTNARSADQVQPDDVADLGTNNGSLDSFHESCCAEPIERPPDPRHHRLAQPQMIGHRPRRQCVASAVSSPSGTINASIRSSPTPRPARALIDQPVRPNSAKRLRHRRTFQSQPQALGKLRVRPAISGCQHNSRPHRQPAALVRRRAHPPTRTFIAVNTISSACGVGTPSLTTN